jgi:hypothetical protein
MIAKSLIAATAIAASVAAFAPQADAKTNIDINVGFGLGGGYYGGGYGYPVYNPYPVYPSYGISCHKGRKIVKWSGFYNVHPVDCGAPVYRYHAWKFGKKFRVSVDIHGNIIKVKKI